MHVDSAWARALLEGAQNPTASHSMNVLSKLLATKAILQMRKLLSYTIKFI